MDTKKIYNDFFKLLENGEEIKIDNNLFILLQNYVQARLHDLVGRKIPVHFYFSNIVSISKGNEHNYVPLRYNPITGEKCNESSWGHFRNAYYRIRDDKEEIFIDFSVSDQYNKRVFEKSGYRKIYDLIDFAFTIEHELNHVLQFENIQNVVLTYDNFKLTKDYIALDFIEVQKDELSRYFYLNAHNSLFIEKDANMRATKFLTQQFLDRKIGSQKIDIFYNGEHKKSYSVFDILNNRIEFAKVASCNNVSYQVNMFFDLENSVKKVEMKDKPEKIIDLLIDGLVRQNPKYYLKEYPILSYKYNEDGTKKTYYEIKKMVDGKPELLTFCKQIVAGDALLKIQKIEDDMICAYCSTDDNEIRSEILKDSLNQIKNILTNETIDLDNVLMYFKKRKKEIATFSSDKGDANLLFFMTGQVILEKVVIQNAYKKISDYKEELLKYQELLNINCGLDFNKGIVELSNDLLRIILNLQNDNINKIYSDKGYSSEEIDKFLHAAKQYYHIINNTEYILNDSSSNECVKGILPGVDNLYQTNYYQNVMGKNSGFEEKILLSNEFELINLMYIEVQKYVGISGLDYETAALAILEESPIITKIVELNPGILETLSRIREMEPKQEYLTKLDALILICKNSLRGSNKTR